jgi:DNA-directed RNA polymerase specialized sigma24 family protein
MGKWRRKAGDIATTGVLNASGLPTDTPVPGKPGWIEIPVSDYLPAQSTPGMVFTDTPAEQKRMIAELKKKLSRKDESKRERTLRLREEGLTVAEIAKREHVSEAAIWQRLGRAKRKRAQ